jgi:polysaccharide export outer membrane protein
MKILVNILMTLLCLRASVLAQVESLRIGPGDQIEIQVFDTPDLNEITRVNDRGEVTLRLGGSVRVASLTPDQAAHALEAVLVNKRIMYAPSVLVVVNKYATQNVTVFGEVSKPASYQIDTPRPVVDVLALAGGFTELADRHITIQHPDGTTAETLLISNDPETSEAGRTFVYPGDKVIVPKAPLIYVLGDVGRPGGYRMNSNESSLTVLQAVSNAGSVQPSGSPNSARLIRRQPDGSHKEVKLALGNLEKGKEQDFPLQADDIIYVPFSYVRNALLSITGVFAAATTAIIYTK